MIGDSFSVNSKTFTIKKETTFGEFRKINIINSRISKLSKNENSDPVELTDAANDQMQIIVDYLESHLGLSYNDIDNMGFPELISVFQKTFELSTTPNKELKKTSD